MMIGRVLGAGGTEVSPLFGLLTLVLVGVVVVSLVLLRFRQSLLVGYFLCGVILANSGVLGWIGASSDDFGVLAELGIILLLFTIGLEFSAPPPSPPDRRPGTQGLEKRFTSNEGDRRLLEVHLFDFEANLYDQIVEVQFGMRLRGERKFEGLEDLKKQILKDVEAGRALFVKGSALDV